MTENSLKVIKVLDEIVILKMEIKDIKLMLVGLHNWHENSSDDSYASDIKNSKTTAEGPASSVPENKKTVFITTLAPSFSIPFWGLLIKLGSDSFGK